ncbi:hypothetical protein GOQ04_15560, partial [Emticicia sp. ODNR4P]|nr:hypothetical protein [Emticicia sp. ODNR4P]
YSTFPIREQAEKGIWNYNLKAVYCIGVLDFTFDDYESEPEKSEVVHTINLKNQHGKVFYDKLTYIYLEMPNFKKEEQELTTRLDKWLYFIKNLEDFQNIPELFKDEVFTHAFQVAELAKMDREDWERYEYSLKVFRDNKATYDYAVETAREEGLLEGMMVGKQEGRQEGRKEGRLEGKQEGKQEEQRNIARQAKMMGLDTSSIQQLTGLSLEEIENL